MEGSHGLATGQIKDGDGRGRSGPAAGAAWRLGQRQTAAIRRERQSTGFVVLPGAQLHPEARDFLVDHQTEPAIELLDRRPAQARAAMKLETRRLVAVEACSL